jgi:isochorismate hydrolase
MNKLSREVPIDPARAALLIIDVQNYCVSGKAEEGAISIAACAKPCCRQ